MALFLPNIQSISKKVHPYELVSKNGIFITNYSAVVNIVKVNPREPFAENDNTYVFIRKVQLKSAL